LVDELIQHTGFRIDVLAFGKDGEVMTLADELTGACLRAGCKCKLFVANSDRHKIISMEGVTLALAGDATPEENDVVPFIVTAVAKALAKSGIRYSTSFGGFRKIDPIEEQDPAGTKRFFWDPADVAPCRIQVSEKNLIDFEWPVTPPQA
jgi:hypothetical protein